MNNSMVINYGLHKNCKDICVPFYIVNKIVCTYSFVEYTDVGAKYLREPGKLKEIALDSLNLDFHIVDIKSNNFNEMCENIKSIHNSFLNKNNIAILYRIIKTDKNDTPFYDSLNIKKENIELKLFEELKIKPKKPFKAFNMKEIIKAGFEIIA